MPRVSSYKVKNLSAQDYKQCRSLCFRSDGYMASSLSQAKNWHNMYKAEVYMMKDDTGKLLSWALIMEWNKEIHFYTRKTERRKGYAKRLSKAIAKKIDIKQYSVDAHDEISEAFYSEVNYNRKI